MSAEREDVPPVILWRGLCPSCGGLNVELSDAEADAIESYTCWDCGDAWGVNVNDQTII